MNNINIENIDFLSLTTEEAHRLGINVLFQENDGTYDWIYCMDFMKNKSMLKFVLKIMAIVFLPIVVIALMSSPDGFDPWQLTLFIPLFVIVMLIVLFSFWLSNKIYRGQYMLVYQMNNDGIMFSQTKDQAKITRTIAATSSAVASAGGNIGSTVTGAAVALRENGTYSKFSNVRSVKGKRKESLIWVNSFLNYQMVYVPEESYDFVWDYITRRCVSARISGR